MNRKARARQGHADAARYFAFLFVVGCVIAAPFHQLWALPIGGLIFVLIPIIRLLIRSGLPVHHTRSTKRRKASE